MGKTRLSPRGSVRPRQPLAAIFVLNPARDGVLAKYSNANLIRAASSYLIAASYPCGDIAVRFPSAIHIPWARCCILFARPIRRHFAFKLAKSKGYSQLNRPVGLGIQVLGY